MAIKTNALKNDAEEVYMNMDKKKYVISKHLDSLNRVYWIKHILLFNDTVKRFRIKKEEAEELLLKEGKSDECKYFYGKKYIKRSRIPSAQRLRLIKFFDL